MNPSTVLLLGRRARIRYNERDFVGLIVAETKHMIGVKTKSKLKFLPKAQTVLWLLGDGEVKIEGSRLVGRPVERMLRGWRR